MMDSHTQTLKRKHDFGSGDLTPPVDGTLPHPPKEGEEDGLQIPRINSWDQFPSKVPKIHHDSHPQASFQSVELHPYDQLRRQTVTSEVPFGRLPPYTHLPSPNFYRPVSAENTDISPATGYASPFSGTTKGYTQPVYPQPLVSLPPHPITNQLNSLPQQIYKTSAYTAQQPLRNRYPSWLPAAQIPVSPPYTQLSTPQTHYQESMLPEQPKYPSNKRSPWKYTGGFKEDTFPSEFKLLPEVQESFLELAPLLTKLTSRNISVASVVIVSNFYDHVSLDEFYSLLYHEETIGHLLNHGLPNDKSFEGTSVKVQRLQLLHLVLKTLKSPRATIALIPGLSIQRLGLPSSKMHDLRRIFLAIKIISSTVKQVEHSVISTFSVSCVAIYKIYFIMCQRLIRKYRTMSGYFGSEESLILGSSRLGKITKLVFPNRMTKRLGRRGHSKAHYIGLTLNYSMIDPDIRPLLDLDITQLQEYFGENSGYAFEEQRLKGLDNSSVYASGNGGHSAETSPVPGSVFSANSPVSSYADTTRMPQVIQASSSPMCKNETGDLSEDINGPRLIWKNPRTP